jgi:DNA-binding GntR family transcriptional regulator
VTASGIASLQALGIDVLDVWKAKQEIETLLLAEAIERVTDDDVQVLDGIIEHMAEAIHLGAYQGYSLSNISFHLRIADIAAQPALKRAENFLLRITQRIYKLSDVTTSDFLLDHLYKSYMTHTEILGVLRERKGADASRVMKSHFDEVNRYLQYVLHEKQND